VASYPQPSKVAEGQTPHRDEFAEAGIVYIHLFIVRRERFDRGGSETRSEVGGVKAHNHYSSPQDAELR